MKTRGIHGVLAITQGRDQTSDANESLDQKRTANVYSCEYVAGLQSRPELAKWHLNANKAASLVAIVESQM